MTQKGNVGFFNPYTIGFQDQKSKRVYIAWASTHHTKLKRIFIKQKQISRMIFFKNKQCHSRPLMKKLGALNVYQTNLYQTLIFMVKFENTTLPKVFYDFFENLHYKYVKYKTFSFPYFLQRNVFMEFSQRNDPELFY